MPFVIPINSTARDELKRVKKNADLQRFTIATLEDCAIRFVLRGNAFEGYRFEIKDSKTVDRSSIIAALADKASRL